MYRQTSIYFQDLDWVCWNCNFESACHYFLSKRNWVSKIEACNFIKNETLAQVFSCEFCEISKNTFHYRTPLVAASIECMLKNLQTLKLWCFFFCFYSSNELLNSSCLLAGYLLFSRQSLYHHINYEKIEKPFNFLMKLKTPPIQFVKQRAQLSMCFFLFSLGIWAESYTFLWLGSTTTLSPSTLSIFPENFIMSMLVAKNVIAPFTHMSFTHISPFTQEVCFLGRQMDSLDLKTFTRVSFPGCTFNYLKTLTSYHSATNVYFVGFWNVS